MDTPLPVEVVVGGVVVDVVLMVDVVVGPAVVTGGSKKASTQYEWPVWRTHVSVMDGFCESC